MTPRRNKSPSPKFHALLHDISGLSLLPCIFQIMGAKAVGLKLLGYVYTYPFLRTALETARASTLKRNKRKGRLQVGGIIQHACATVFFNFSFAWKRPFSLIVSKQVSVYSVYMKLRSCRFQKFPL